MKRKNNLIDDIETVSTVMYAEFSRHLFVISDYEEYLKSVIDIIDLDYYIDVLNVQINTIAENNVYPNIIIDRIKKIIEYLKTIDKKYENQLDEMHEKLDKITDFNFDFLNVEFELKYAKIENVGKLSGVNFDDAIFSISNDFNVFLDIKSGSYNSELGERTYILTIKKYMILYPELFKDNNMFINVNKILDIISDNKDESIKKEALKLKKQIDKESIMTYNDEQFKIEYQAHLITGLIFRTDFESILNRLDKKLIMNLSFIENLVEYIYDCIDYVDERVIDNLRDLVIYIGEHYHEYGSEDILPVIHEMKRALNKEAGYIADFIYSNILSREDKIGRLKWKFYYKTKNHDKISDLSEEIFDSEYDYFRMLQSLIVSDEDFETEYLYDFIYDNSYIKNIRKLLKLYPCIIYEKQACERIEKVFDMKLKSSKLDISSLEKFEHYKMLKKIKSYKE